MSVDRGIGSIRSAGMYDTLPVIRSVWALIPLGNTLVTAITVAGAQNVIANSQRVGFHSHKQNEIKQQKL